MNPVNTHCLTEKIWKGKMYRNIFEISIEIDEINQIEGRTLAIKNIKDRFRAVCKFCKARVTGSYQENDEIIVDVVIHHTCQQNGYYPSQLKKKQAIEKFKVSVSRLEINPIAPQIIVLMSNLVMSSSHTSFNQNSNKILIHQKIS